jgi:hypothetical protein
MARAIVVQVAALAPKAQVGRIAVLWRMIQMRRRADDADHLRKVTKERIPIVAIQMVDSIFIVPSTMLITCPDSVIFDAASLTRITGTFLNLLPDLLPVLRVASFIVRLNGH